MNFLKSLHNTEHPHYEISQNEAPSHLPVQISPPDMQHAVTSGFLLPVTNSLLVYYIKLYMKIFKSLHFYCTLANSTGSNKGEKSLIRDIYQKENSYADQYFPWFNYNQSTDIPNLSNHRPIKKIE